MDFISEMILLRMRDDLSMEYDRLSRITEPF